MVVCFGINNGVIWCRVLVSSAHLYVLFYWSVVHCYHPCHSRSFPHRHIICIQVDQDDQMHSSWSGWSVDGGRVTGWTWSTIPQFMYSTWSNSKLTFGMSRFDSRNRLRRLGPDTLSYIFQSVFKKWGYSVSRISVTKSLSPSTILARLWSLDGGSRDDNYSKIGSVGPRYNSSLPQRDPQVLPTHLRTTVPLLT